MLDLARNGYTRQEVIDQLHGKKGSRGLVKIRYDLLNRQDVKLGELAVQSGKVSMNSLAEIKRTASFELTEQEAQDVDWLNDRIRPVFCLKMPEIRKTYKAWGKIDTSFSRPTPAYLSDGTRVAANTPRFEVVDNRMGWLVEEGTTNLLTANQSSVETDISGLNSYNATIVRDTTTAWHGSASAKVTANANSVAGLWTTEVPIQANTVYTFSCYLKGSNQVRINFEWYNSTMGRLGAYNGTICTLSSDWQRFSSTATSPTGAAYVRITLYTPDMTRPSFTFWYDGGQLEQKPYATSFTDGTRAAETLTIPTEGVLNPQEGTVECWVYVNDILKDSIVNSRHIIDARGSGNNALILYHDHVTRNFRFRLRNYSGVQKDLDIPDSVVTNGWHFFSIKWSQTNMTLCIDNNAQFAENPPLPSDLSTCTIGRHPSVPTATISTLIDDLRISSRARSDAEILAAYQSGQPAPVDEWTTAKFDFDNRLTGEYFTIVNDSKPVQWIEWPLGVFLLSSPTRKDENRKVKRSIEAYDSSLILKEDKFTDRYVIEAGTKYTDAIIDILNAAGIWKINIIDHPGTLATDREFEIGTTKLYAVNELLAAINYTSLWVDENGYFVAQPYVLPSDRDPEYEYRTDDLSIIHPGAEEELDLFAVPNKFVRYVSNPDRAVILRSEYTNDLSTSPISTINRGRTIVDIDHVEDIYDQATLDEYVKRIAYNASQVYGKFDFVTALMPHHSYYNCLFVEYDPLGISHKYMESSWTMDLHANGVMRHSCRRVIQI